MSITEQQPGPGNGQHTEPASSQEQLHHLADEAGASINAGLEKGAEHYQQIRDLATDQLDSLVEGAQSAASALEGKDSLGLSQYLGQLANGLGSFADQVRDNSAEDLLHKGAQLARDNPALFLAGSVAIGFGLSRLLRASAGHGATAAQGMPAPTRSATPRMAYGADAPYQSSAPSLAGGHLPTPMSELPTTVAMDDPDASATLRSRGPGDTGGIRP